MRRWRRRGKRGKEENENENDHSSSQSSVHKGLTCRKGQSAWAVAPSLSGKKKSLGAAPAPAAREVKKDKLPDCIKFHVFTQVERVPNLCHLDKLGDLGGGGNRGRGIKRSTIFPEAQMGLQVFEEDNPCFRIHRVRRQNTANAFGCLKSECALGGLVPLSLPLSTSTPKSASCPLPSYRRSVPSAPKKNKPNLT